jgi:hypothetical protein
VSEEEGELQDNDVGDVHAYCVEEGMQNEIMNHDNILN